MSEIIEETANDTEYDETLGIRYKHPTNADKIRHMTDEELAEFIEQASCPPTTKKIYHECTKDDCVPCWLEWLKQGVSDA